MGGYWKAAGQLAEPRAIGQLLFLADNVGQRP